MPNILEERIKKWKDKLIDLSKRNRLLNFRPTKVTSIHIVDELPPEVLRILVVDNSSVSFLPILKENEDLFNQNEEILESQEYQTYKKEGLDAKHTDLHLQTRLKKEHLSKNLQRISSKASSVMEEQGYNVLFLALGFLEWYESNDSDVKLRAPIILVPVELTRTSVRSDFKLKYTEDDPPFVNPALIQKLQNDYGIKVNLSLEELEDVDSQKVYSKFQKAIDGLERWRLTNDIYLSLFSFAKFIMYKDIEKFLKMLLGNRIIQAICGQVAEKDVSLDLLSEPKDLDKTLHPIKTFQVLDADSSQQQAILAAKNGESLIIEGPPGTGKSQTIANIIAECLVDGKKVMFVSQKMAALEVVKKRLDNAGLKDLCLELHSRKTNKNEVIKELARVLEQEKKPDHSHDEDLSKLEEIRDSLNTYVRDLHTPFGKLEFTPFKAYGMLSQCGNVKENGFVFQDADKWDKKRFDSCFDNLEDLVKSLEKVGQPYEHPWYGSRLKEFHYADKIKLQESFETFLADEIVFQAETSKVAQLVHFRCVDCLKDIKLLMEVCSVLLNSPVINREILTSERWDVIYLMNS